MTTEWQFVCIHYTYMFSVYKVDYRGAAAPKNNLSRLPYDFQAILGLSYFRADS